MFWGSPRLGSCHYLKFFPLRKDYEYAGSASPFTPAVAVELVLVSSFRCLPLNVDNLQRRSMPVGWTRSSTAGYGTLTRDLPNMLLLFPVFLPSSFAMHILQIFRCYMARRGLQICALLAL